MRLLLLAWLYILTAFGLAFVVGYAKISLPFREWLTAQVEVRDALGFYSKREPRFVGVRRWLLELLQCPACLGVWVGGVFALVDPAFFGAASALGLNHLPVEVLSLVFGLATAASNFILGALTGLIEVH